MEKKHFFPLCFLVTALTSIDYATAGLGDLLGGAVKSGVQDAVIQHTYEKTFNTTKGTLDNAAAPPPPPQAPAPVPQSPPPATTYEKPAPPPAASPLPNSTAAKNPPPAKSEDPFWSLDRKSSPNIEARQTTKDNGATNLPTPPANLAPATIPERESVAKKEMGATTKTFASREEEELYNQGLALFQEQKYKNAHAGFTNFISKFPKSEHTPSARLLLGDCYYQQNEYELAILEYQKLIAAHPTHAQTPVALLKQGLTFEQQLKDKETAQIVYRKVLSDFPRSEQAAEAQKQINSLK